jgi:hypothetical protein
MMNFTVAILLYFVLSVLRLKQLKLLGFDNRTLETEYSRV